MLWGVGNLHLPVTVGLVVSYPDKPSSLKDGFLFLVPFPADSGDRVLGAIHGAIAPKVTGKEHRAAGISVGLRLPILGGLVWMRLYPGFGSRPAIFTGSLLTAGPSSAGGGF